MYHCFASLIWLGPTWALGSYVDIATFLSHMSAHLVRAAGISRGEHVLDVGCGTGITAITACSAGPRQNPLEFWTDEKICRQKWYA
jgi:protein-L-isoaspartate O-methyltransferase